jgi:hypothetical protein
VICRTTRRCRADTTADGSQQADPKAFLNGEFTTVGQTMGGTGT